MKKLLLPIFASLPLLLALPSAHADTYHRFWQGMKLETLSAQLFETDLNQVFIPATVQTGAGQGMIAYEPVLTLGIAGLPDEVALVSYQDLEAYNQLYSTAPGKAYQNLHAQYFDMSLSHSLVPAPYTGSPAIGAAYDLHPSYADWEKNQTTFLVFMRGAGETDSDFLARAAAHLNQVLATDLQNGVLDRAILIAPSYWLEYVSANGALAATFFGADYCLPVTSESPATAQILPGSGVNLQF